MPLVESDNLDRDEIKPGNGMDYPVRYQNIRRKNSDTVYIFHAGYILSNKELLRRPCPKCLSGCQNGRICNVAGKEVVPPAGDLPGSDFIARGEHGYICEIVHVRRSIGGNQALEEFEINGSSGAANTKQFPEGQCHYVNDSIAERNILAVIRRVARLNRSGDSRLTFSTTLEVRF